MKISINAVSIVREGFFRGDILDQLRKYGDNFKPLPSQNSHEKYGLYVPETPSLVVVSRLKGDIVLNPNGTNLYATFSSYSQQKDLEMIAEFEEKTGIRIRNDHPNLRAIGMLMNIFFEDVVRKGPEAMDILGRM